MLSDTPNGNDKYSRCEKLANSAIGVLQWYGYLPGSKDVISFSIKECTTEI